MPYPALLGQFSGSWAGRLPDLHQRRTMVCKPALKAGAIQLVVYTTTGALSFEDEKSIRRSAITYRVPCITTMSGARATVEAITSRQRDPIRVWSLQEIHAPS